MSARPTLKYFLPDSVLPAPHARQVKLGANGHTEGGCVLPGGDHEGSDQCLGHPQGEGERVLPHDGNEDQRQTDGGMNG